MKHMEYERASMLAAMVEHALIAPPAVKLKASQKQLAKTAADSLHALAQSLFEGE